MIRFLMLKNQSIAGVFVMREKADCAAKIKCIDHIQQYLVQFSYQI